MGKPFTTGEVRQLVKMYVVERKSIEKIAWLLDRSAYGIRYRLKQAGVSLRPVGRGVRWERAQAKVPRRTALYSTFFFEAAP